MKASQNCIDLIKSFEGCILHVYNDVAGLPTIGIGHLIKPTEHFTTITEDEAEDLLRKDLSYAESAVNQCVNVDINQNQFDALVSLTFNIGGGNLLNSHLLELLNEDDFTGAADQFLRWDKGHVNGKLIKIAGLTRRREAERQLFLS